MDTNSEQNNPLNAMLKLHNIHIANKLINNDYVWNEMVLYYFLEYDGIIPQLDFPRIVMIAPGY